MNSQGSTARAAAAFIDDTSSRSKPSLDDGRDLALVELVKWLMADGYRFTTVTPLTHERVNRRPENQLAKDMAGIFGWSRPFKEHVVPPRVLDLMSAAGVLRREEQGWSSAVRVSTINGLAIVHSAFPTTQEDSVFFGPDTYRFVNEITGHLSACGRPIRRAVDIGCGAGPGAMTICQGRPEAEVFGVDINPEALRLARVNAYLAGVTNLVCRRSDLLRGVEGDFDLIVANPPYLIDPAKRAYRHGGGLHGAGLSLSILDSALTRLAPSGSLVLYTGSTIVNGVDGFREEVETRLRHPEYTWRYREIDPDIFSEELLCEAYADADRIAAVVLTVNRT